MAFLIEKYAGAFPLWLSPVQARYSQSADTHEALRDEVLAKLKAAGIRAELDDSHETLGKKIRDAKTAKVPYMLVIGDQEVADKTATLEGREGKLGALSIEDIVTKLADEIKNRT